MFSILPTRTNLRKVIQTQTKYCAKKHITSKQVAVPAAAQDAAGRARESRNGRG